MYGEKVFEIDDSYIRYTILYNVEVLSQLNKNVGMNVRLNKTEKAILSYLIEEPNLTSDESATKIDVTRRTIDNVKLSYLYDEIKTVFMVNTIKI